MAADLTTYDDVVKRIYTYVILYGKDWRRELARDRWSQTGVLRYRGVEG